MGDMKVCLLLLLGSCALAKQDTETTTCLLEKRFKSFRKYEYQYVAETQNQLSGTASLRNGPKVTCKVEMEVPQACSFILRTTECTLAEVSEIDPAGQPVYTAAAGAEVFQAAMEKHTLKFMVEDLTQVKLFPEEGEPSNILNIKRGIISSLLVPVMEEENNRYMATIHGLCQTDFTVNSREEIATDVTVTRDLSKCDHFSPMKDTTSPLALVTGLHFPVSLLVRSTQTCSYQFDNKKKHMTAGTCTEKHIFLLGYGLSTLVKQTLTLQEFSKTNNRVFGNNEANLKALHMETAEEKAPIQTRDQVLSTLRELSTLSQTQNGHQRAALFQKLVVEIRMLRNETLGSVVTEMLEVSQSLTLQALTQCGTPECTSAILQVLRTFHSSALEVDAAVYALGLLPNPSKHHIQDMLSMAQHKQSKAILYALSNSVRRFYQKEGIVTPEMTAVSEFMTSLLGSDCSRDKDLIFLTLRVLGNMGGAMEAAKPGLKSVLIKCMRQPATSLAVQQAAIQALRRMTITDEVRSNLQKVFQYSKGPVQKRVAAYLVLMRSPEASDLKLVKRVLEEEQNMQVKSFVTSHIYNIVNSKDSGTKEIREKINEALRGEILPPHTEYSKFSRNYKMETSAPLQSAVHGNLIFDLSSNIPREVMLETTLKVFGYNLDMMEFGIDGKGFEPTIDAIFGENGFFPDMVSKAIYWAGDKMTDNVNKILKDCAAPPRTDGVKGQVPVDIVKEMKHNFNNLMKELNAQESPEAVAYLRIMGAELGYIKANELRSIASSAAMYAEILYKIIPAKLLKNLKSGTENQFFAHYIFMDSEVFLPTSSGFPLKFSLSGTFAPGARGGLSFSPKMQEVSFMPSVGVEFVTRMGVHIPQFIVSGIELHTTVYHESALNAKVVIADRQIKLAIPAPQGPTQLLSISNRMLSVPAAHTKLIPPMTKSRTNSMRCSALFTGVKSCITVRYPSADSTSASPHFPLTGETNFAVEIQPTGEVSEYTATIAYDLLKEGKVGGHKVDVQTITLKAEGVQPPVATATIKYYRTRNVLTTNIQIPDYDIEGGIRLGFTDDNVNGQTLTADITNKNVTLLSLVGLSKLGAVKDSLLKAQMIIPSLETDIAVTGALKKGNDLTLELESSIKVSETSSLQKATFRYDDNRVEVELKSDLSSKPQKLISKTAGFQRKVQQLTNDILDQGMGKTDLKLPHIFSKSLEAGSIWLNKVAANIPYMKKLRNIPEFTLPSMPEKLFLKSEGHLRYQFNKNSFIITLPLPLGGKTSMDLNFPRTIATPHLAVHQICLEIPSREISVPSYSIPHRYDLTVPLIGMAELSAKVNSNFYTWEGSISGGNSSMDTASYIAKYKVMSDSPLEILSYKIEGTALVADTPAGNLEISVNGSLRHSLIQSSFSIVESLSITDKVKASGSHKVRTSSPLGLEVSLEHVAHSNIAPEEITGDSHFQGTVVLGTLTTSTAFNQSYLINPISRDAWGESTLRVSSPVLQVSSNTKGLLANGKFSVDSDTSVHNGALRHVKKISISYRSTLLSVKSDSIFTTLGGTLRNQVDFSTSGEVADLRVESQADYKTSRAYALLSGSLKAQGMEVNTDASINLNGSRGSHKATLTLGRKGLSTSGTTTLRYRPLTFENVFNGAMDGSGATLSLVTKGTAQQNTVEVNVEGKLDGHELNVNSVYKGNIFDMNSRNRMNLRVNQEGLIFSDNLVGSLHQMKTENTHTLTLNVWNLVLYSKTDNFISNSTSYKHDLRVDMKPLITSVNLNQYLKLLDASFSSVGQFSVRPYKVNLTGQMRGEYGENALRHKYEISHNDLATGLKSSTDGKIQGIQVAHSAELEVVGLSSKFNTKAHLNSELMHLDGTFYTVAEPFSLSADTVIKADLELYGKHGGQLYSKLLLKAEPPAVTYTHDCSASMTHKRDRGDFAEGHFRYEMDSLLAPQEQSGSMRVTSRLNNHTYIHKVSANNNPERIGTEMSMILHTDFLEKSGGKNQEFSISGFFKYEKNNDSHIIELPFKDYLPAIFKQLRNSIIKLKDSSFALLKDFEAKYIIRTKLQGKLSELKQVMESFDTEMFGQDVSRFVITSVKKYSQQLRVQMNRFVESLKRMSSKLIVANMVTAAYKEMKVLSDRYEIGKILEDLKNQAVEFMKQYKEDYLKSADFRSIYENASQQLKNLLDQLKAIDFRSIINVINVNVDRFIKKAKLFDYDAFFNEANQNIFKLTGLPAFGKLRGELTVSSPHYILRTSVELQNSTTSPVTPQFTAALISQATSTAELLAYSMDAHAHLAAIDQDRLALNETLKVTHMAFSVEHQGSATLHRLSAKASSRTTAKVATGQYTADLVNIVFLTLGDEVSASVDTIYSHKLNVPVGDVSSQATITQKAVARLDSATVSITVGNHGNGKWSIRGYSDVGAHMSDLEFTFNVNGAKLNFKGETNSQALKMKQTVNAESVAFGHVALDVRAETQAPFIQSSIVDLRGKVQGHDLKLELTASHDTELIGNVRGTSSNSVHVLVQPFRVIVHSKNKGNAKIILPLKLIVKVDFQDDYAVTLDSEVQQASWTGLAGFNQFKCSHYFTLNNTEKEMGFYAAINGEADLDSLMVPITISKMILPFTAIKTPSVTDFSLWEDTGLKDLLVTTQQSIDMKVKLQYHKDPEMFAIDIDTQPIYNTIHENAKILNKNFVLRRDKVIGLLGSYYAQSEERFEKFKTDTSSQLPKIITMPGYTIPILNIQISPVVTELPTFSFGIPKAGNTTMLWAIDFSKLFYTLKFPEAFSQMTLPNVTLPTMRTRIMLPVMGNVAYDFSLKSPMIALNANIGLNNQDDVVLQFGASSTSVFQILRGSLEGAATLTKKRSLKLATSLSLEHMNLEGSHESTVSVTKKGMDASMETVAKVSLPSANLEFRQELAVNGKAKPNVASKMKLKYSFNLPLIKGEGDIDQSLQLDELTTTAKVNLTYLNLVINQELSVNSKNGVIASISSPSSGLLGFQLQSRNPSQMDTRLFSRFLSASENDVEILAIKMINFKKLDFQTSWNTEYPEILLQQLNEWVPPITSALKQKETVSSMIDRLSSKIAGSIEAMESSFERFKNQSMVRYERTTRNLREINAGTISNNVRLLRQQFQKNVRILLDAAVKFTKEGQFQLPFYKEVAEIGGSKSHDF